MYIVQKCIHFLKYQLKLWCNLLLGNITRVLQLQLSAVFEYLLYVFSCARCAEMHLRSWMRAFLKRQLWPSARKHHLRHKWVHVCQRPLHLQELCVQRRGRMRRRLGRGGMRAVVLRPQRVPVRELLVHPQQLGVRRRRRLSRKRATLAAHAGIIFWFHTRPAGRRRFRRRLPSGKPHSHSWTNLHPHESLTF